MSVLGRLFTQARVRRVVSAVERHAEAGEHDRGSAGGAALRKPRSHAPSRLFPMVVVRIAPAAGAHDLE